MQKNAIQNVDSPKFARALFDRTRNVCRVGNGRNLCLVWLRGNPGKNFPRLLTYWSFVIYRCMDYFLSTHADRQGVDTSVTVFCLFACLFVRLRISLARIKLAHHVKFCTVVYECPRQGISHFGELPSPEAQNRTNRPPTRK